MCACCKRTFVLSHGQVFNKLIAVYFWGAS